jgi:hypothetical protein
MVAFRSKRCAASNREDGKLIIGKLARWFENLRMKALFKMNKRRGNNTYLSSMRRYGEGELL